MDVKVAICQKPPVLLDLAASLAVAVTAIEEAAGNGARLVLFPEAFLPGYPTWIWRLRPGADMALGNIIHAELRRNAVDMARDGLAAIRAAAARHAVIVAIGFHEVDSIFSGTTLYNSVAVIGADGALLNHHRKLMPTNPERMVWGLGDARGLSVVETPIGRVGILMCWECYMPLARFALYAQAMDILLAPTWDNGDSWVTAMNFVAREGGCWVLSTATALRGADVPADFPGRSQLFTNDEWINTGGAVVVKPGGGVMAGPLHREQTILYASIDPEASREARKSLDVAGHYGRPDVFRLEVDRGQRVPVGFNDGES